MWSGLVCAATPARNDAMGPSADTPDERHALGIAPRVQTGEQNRRRVHGFRGCAGAPGGVRRSRACACGRVLTDSCIGAWGSAGLGPSLAAGRANARRACAGGYRGPGGGQGQTSTARGDAGQWQHLVCSTGGGGRWEGGDGGVAGGRARRSGRRREEARRTAEAGV